MKLRSLLPGAALALAWTSWPSQADAQVVVYGPPPPPRPMFIEPPDGPRVRFGFEIFGGPMWAPQVESTGGLGGAAARIGVQIDHLWGVYYQNTAWLGALLTATSSDVAGVLLASDFNSIVGSVTLGHFFEVALGPSIDVFAGAGCSAGASGGYCGVGTQAAFGIHSRFAFQLGTFMPRRPRRVGFSLQLEVHPVFLNPYILVPVTFGLGADFF